MTEKSILTDKLYSEIEQAIISWEIDGTKTAGTLTREIIQIINKTNKYENQRNRRFSKRHSLTVRSLKSRIRRKTERLNQFCSKAKKIIAKRTERSITRIRKIG